MKINAASPFSTAASSDGLGLWPKSPSSVERSIGWRGRDIFASGLISWPDLFKQGTKQIFEERSRRKRAFEEKFGIHLRSESWSLPGVPKSNIGIAESIYRARISVYGKHIRTCIAHLGFERSLVEVPNLADAAENTARKQLLACYRGYPERALFTGFPQDATWRRVGLEPRDFAIMR
jgi:hypothetical protein